MLTRRAFVRAMFLVPPALVVGTGCSGSSPSMTVSLDYDSPAPLGGTMTFRLTASCRRDIPSPREPGVTASVSFSLQDGLTAVSPLDPQWVTWRLGDDTVSGTGYRRSVAFTAFIPQTFELQVRLDQPGDLRIRGAAAENGAAYGQRDNGTALFLRISPTSTQIQRKPFPSNA